jgi:orotate phosphoribosyltransferase
MNYVTYRQLLHDVMELERRLPRDISAVIGIPRSGMLPASIIAQHRNIPLGSFSFRYDGLTKLKTGNRLDKFKWNDDGRFLLIDDSIYRGTAMAEALANCREDEDDRDFVTAAVYGSPDTPAGMEADYIGRVVPGPRYFAWNLFHHADLAQAMFDMDGVLCYDPTCHDDHRGGEYEAWLPNAVPFNVPSVPIHSICTNRLRIWRSETTEWLDRHGVRYGALHMSPHDSPASRTAGAAFGHYKGEMYRDSDCTLFIESDDAQARTIAFISGKPVIALDTGKVY